MTYIAWLITASVLLLPGILLSALPLPGILYMLAIAAGFGALDRFAHLSGLELAILAAVAAVTMLLDFLSGMIGAKWGGAHWTSIIWGFVGLIIGSAIIPIPFFGSIIGMILGVLASELFRTKDIAVARKAAAGSFFGWAAGTVFKVIAAIVFLILFIVFAAS